MELQLFIWYQYYWKLGVYLVSLVIEVRRFYMTSNI